MVIPRRGASPATFLKPENGHARYWCNLRLHHYVIYAGLCVLAGPGDHTMIDLIDLILEVGSELLPILAPLIWALAELLA